MPIKCQNCGLQMGGASRIYRDGSILDRCFRCGYEQPTAPQVITAGTESQPASKVFLAMIRFVTRNCAEMSLGGWEIALRHAHKWSLDEVDEFIGWAADTNLWRTVQVNLHGRGGGVDTSNAPLSVVDTPVVNSKDLAAKRDVLLDQFSKEQDPQKKEQLKSRLRSLSKLMRRGAKWRGKGVWLLNVSSIQRAYEEEVGGSYRHEGDDLLVPVNYGTRKLMSRYKDLYSVTIITSDKFDGEWYKIPGAYKDYQGIDASSPVGVFMGSLSQKDLDELLYLSYELFGNSLYDLGTGSQTEVVKEFERGIRSKFPRRNELSQELFETGYFGLDTDEQRSMVNQVWHQELLENAPIGTSEVAMLNPKDLSSKRDALLDQLSKEQDPAKKEQVKSRLRSLSVKRWATIKGCLAGLVPVYADNLGDLEVAHETLKYIFERELRVTGELEFMPEDGEKGDDAVALSFKATMNLLKLIVPACVRYAMDTQDSKPLVEVGKLVGVLKQYAAEHRKAMNQGDQDYQNIEHSHSYAPGNASQQQGTWG